MVVSKRGAARATRPGVVLTLRQVLRDPGCDDEVLRERVEVAAASVLESLERPDGELDEVTFEAPWLTPRVAGLRDQGERLAAAATELRTRVVAAGPVELRRLCAGFLELCWDYEALRHELIQTAYSSNDRSLTERWRPGAPSPRNRPLRR